MTDDFTRDESGKFVGQQPNAITAENARERQLAGVRSRRERARAAAEKGLMEGMPPDRLAKDVYGGISTVVSALTRMALSEKGHASVRAAELLFRMVDALPDARGGNHETGGNINVTIPPQEALRLLRLMEKRPEVIDVTPKEVQPPIHRRRSTEDEDG